MSFPGSSVSAVHYDVFIHYEVFSKCDSSGISCYTHWQRKRLSLDSRLAVFFDCDNKLKTTGEPMFTGKGLTLMSCVRAVNVFILALNGCKGVYFIDVFENTFSSLLILQKIIMW